MSQELAEQEQKARSEIAAQLDAMKDFDFPDEPNPDDPTLPTKSEVAALRAALANGDPLPKGWNRVDVVAPDLNDQAIAAEIRAANPEVCGKQKHDDKNSDCPLNDPETFANPVTSGLDCTCPVIAQPTVVEVGHGIKAAEPKKPAARCVFCMNTATYAELLPDGPPQGFRPAEWVTAGVLPEVDRTKSVELPLCDLHYRRRLLLLHPSCGGDRSFIAPPKPTDVMPPSARFHRMIPADQRRPPPPPVPPPPPPTGSPF